MEGVAAKLAAVRASDEDFSTALQRIEALVDALNRAVADQSLDISKGIAEQQNSLDAMEATTAALSERLAAAGTLAALRSSCLDKGAPMSDAPLKKICALQGDQVPVKCRPPAQRPALDFFQTDKPAAAAPRYVRLTDKDKAPLLHKDAPGAQGVKRSAAERDDELVHDAATSSMSSTEPKRQPRPPSMRGLPAELAAAKPSIPQRIDVPLPRDRPPPRLPRGGAIVGSGGDTDVVSPVRKAASLEDLEKPRPLPRPPARSVGAEDDDVDDAPRAKPRPPPRPGAMSLDDTAARVPSAASSRSGAGEHDEDAPRAKPPTPARSASAAATSSTMVEVEPPRQRVKPPPRPARDMPGMAPSPDDEAPAARTKPPPSRPTRAAVAEDNDAVAPPAASTRAKQPPPPRPARDVAVSLSSEGSEEGGSKPPAPAPRVKQPPPRPVKAAAALDDDDEPTPGAAVPPARAKPPARPVPAAGGNVASTEDTARRPSKRAPVRDGDAAVGAEETVRAPIKMTPIKPARAVPDDESVLPPAPRPRQLSTAAAAAPSKAPKAAPAVLNIGTGVAPGKEYARPAKGSAALAKYAAMQKAGLPQGAIENAMMRDGVHPAALFDAPLNNPTSVAAAVVIVKADKPKPVVGASVSAGKAAKPPGMSMMEEMKWKQAQKRKDDDVL